MKLIKNKNEIINNTDVDKDNILIVTREVAEKLDAIIGTQAPEKGGFLFENNGVVDEFIYDYSADTSAGSYTPDTEVMTLKINAAIASGKTLCGMFHSHPKGYIKPSSADIEYAMRIIAAYGLDSFIVGVGQISKSGLVMYYYRVRKGAHSMTTERIQFRVTDSYETGLNVADNSMRSRLSSHRYDKISKAIDIEAMRLKTVIIAGLGGAMGHVLDLARCGVCDFRLIDPDYYQDTNISNQYASITNLGRMKVEVAKEKILEINPSAHVTAIPRALDDDISDEEFVALVGHEILTRPDNYLIEAYTDSFYAQARAAALSVKYATHFLAAQMYKYGDAAEVAFTSPGVTASCPRCLLESRYRAYKRGFKNDVTSFFSTIFSTGCLNALCGQIALMQLQYGCKNSRYGKMLEAVKDRNLVQIKITPFHNDVSNELFEEALDKEFAFCNSAIWIPQWPDDDCPLCGGEGNLLKSKDRILDTRRNLI